MNTQAADFTSANPPWPRCLKCNGRLPCITEFGNIVPDCNKCHCDVPFHPEHSDNVNHPPHYTVGAIECIDAIRAALTDDEFRGYCKGNALKYIWRERHKGNNESLQKAEWYLKRLSQCPPQSPAK